MIITLFSFLVGHTNYSLRVWNWGLGWKRLERAERDITSYALVEMITQRQHSPA